MQPSNGNSSQGSRATEFVAPLVLVVLLSLGIWWYVSQVWQRVEQRPAAPPSDLRQSLPPLPGKSDR